MRVDQRERTRRRRGSLDLCSLSLGDDGGRRFALADACSAAAYGDALAGSLVAPMKPALFRPESVGDVRNEGKAAIVAHLSALAPTPACRLGREISIPVAPHNDRGLSIHSRHETKGRRDLFFQRPRWKAQIRHPAIFEFGSLGLVFLRHLP
jgi:hypothetical protein